MKSLLFTVIASLLMTASLFSQENDQEKYLLDFKEIFDIMEKSRLSYTPNIVEEYDPVKKEELPTLHNQLYIKKEGEHLVLKQYELSGEATEIYNKGEEAYKAGEFDRAIGLYKNVLEADKEYNKIFTMIGDMYYMKKEYGNAKYYFKLAIEKNFIDCTAHWFLADTYKALGEKEEALKEITIAHLLNRNHKDIAGILKKYRTNADRKWSDWAIVPQCTTYQEADNVVIETTNDWLGYACAEAVWKFEPGFAESVIGKKYDGNEGIVEKESACMVANLPGNKIEVINDIVKDGYFQEMIWYEIVSKKVPAGMLLIPESFFARVVEYVNKYH